MLTPVLCGLDHDVHLVFLVFVFYYVCLVLLIKMKSACSAGAFLRPRAGVLEVN